MREDKSPDNESEDEKDNEVTTRDLKTPITL
jgi:hypothetical protein